MVRTRQTIGTTTLAALTIIVIFASKAQTAEVLCDPSYQDCRARLLTLIYNERVGIDVAFLFMEDQTLANALIARHKAGVRVRALVEPRRNTVTPGNATILSMLKNAGIPMRAKAGGGMLHWKFMSFSGQNTVQFSAANYSDYYFRPTAPYSNYTDEGIFFSDDPVVMRSFLTRFDDSWIDAAGFLNYANVSGPLARVHPVFPIDPALNFVPWQNFATRSIPRYDAETVRIDVVMYKITEPSHADGLIRARKRGLPVRLITEPNRYRSLDNLWHAYHVDRLYAAGVQIRDRAHQGFLHQKTTLLYGQGLAVFGSSNWTIESNKSQHEHNYFTTKAWFFEWFRRLFDRKWRNAAGYAETKPFVPLPPGVPAYVAPANGATNVAASTAVYLSWKPGPWAHRADVYFGTASTPPLLAANVSVSPSSTKKHALPTLTPGVKYYWRIVSRTMANKTTSGPTWTFIAN